MFELLGAQEAYLGPKKLKSETGDDEDFDLHFKIWTSVKSIIIYFFTIELRINFLCFGNTILW